MDPDSYPDDKRKKTKTSNTLLDDRNVSESIWIRRYSIELNQINRFLLESQFRYVLPGGILFWSLFLLFGK